MRNVCNEPGLEANTLFSHINLEFNYVYNYYSCVKGFLSLRSLSVASLSPGMSTISRGE